MDALSYIEVALTVMSWQFYNDIVSLFYTLNLHLLPFAWIILRNWFETNKSQDAGHASVTALKRNEVDVYTAIIICLLFWVPNSATTMSPSEASYHFNNKVEDSEDVTTITYTKGSSSWDVKVDSEVELPPAWWALIKLSKAVIYQIIDWTDIDQNYAQMMSFYSSIKIDDQALKSEVDDFFTTCYQPTLSKHQASEYLPPSAKNADVSWIGSDLFLNTPGYYGGCPSSYVTANKCVLEIPYLMPYKISDRYGIPSGYSNDGVLLKQPSCKDWWVGENPQTGDVDQDFGLKEKLNEYINGYQKLMGVDIVYTSDEELNSAIKRLLKNDRPTLSYLPEWNEQEDVDTWFQAASDTVQQGAGAIGSAIVAGMASIFAETIKPSLPIIQALFMLMTVVASPFVLLFTAFSPVWAFSMVYTMFIAISLSFVWHIANLIDNKLMESMYPDVKILTEWSLTGSTQDAVWVIISAFTYVAFPAIWIGFLGKLGGGMANSIEGGMSDMKSKTTKMSS